MPPKTTVHLQVNGEGLWQRLMALARIGATDKGGVCRLALTKLDRQGRALFTQWAQELSCSVRTDAIGNLFARRAGADDSLPAVATGSHIDTQPTAAASSTATTACWPDWRCCIR